MEVWEDEEAEELADGRSYSQVVVDFEDGGDDGGIPDRDEAEEVVELSDGESCDLRKWVQERFDSMFSELRRLRRKDLEVLESFFLACDHQLFANRKNWKGNVLTFPDLMPKRKKEDQSISHRVADWMNRKRKILVRSSQFDIGM